MNQTSKTSIEYPGVTLPINLETEVCTLERKVSHRECYMGHLPAKAPLANPYVPFQRENPPQYEPRTGLIRGTMYPGLDLPFKGIVNKKEKPITRKTELQVLSFAIQELALYLDTHRDDLEALELYRAYQNHLQKCREEFVKHCGPINHMSISDGPYRWLDDPWPWEYAWNKEG